MPHPWHHSSFFLLSFHPPGVRQAVESLSSFCDSGCAYLYFLSFQRSLFHGKLRVPCRKRYCFSHLQLFTLCYQYFPTNMPFRGCYADTNANGYIILLFHYSACFLKSIKSPFCRCSYSLTAHSYLYPVWRRSLDILVSWSQLWFRIIWINWSPTPSIQIHDPDERWALVKTSSVLRASPNQGAKGEEQMSPEGMSPKITITELPSVGMSAMITMEGL